MMGAYVQAVRCKLLARDGCSVLDAASRYALPTPPCAPHPPIFGCDPSVLTPWTASCSQARHVRPPSTSSVLLGAVSSTASCTWRGAVWARGGAFSRARAAGGVGSPGRTAPGGLRIFLGSFLCITFNAPPAARIACTVHLVARKPACACVSDQSVYLVSCLSHNLRARVAT